MIMTAYINIEVNGEVKESYSIHGVGDTKNELYTSLSFRARKVLLYRGLGVKVNIPKRLRVGWEKISGEYKFTVTASPKLELKH